MPRAYTITADAIAAERARVNNDLSKFDVSRVLKMDTLELRPMSRRDVHLRILAVSAEHNVDHAAIADTVNITELRGGKIYPGNSAVGEVLAVGAEVSGLQARRHRHYALQRRARHLWLSAAHLGLRPARFGRMVRRGGDSRRLADYRGAAQVRAEPVGDRGAAAARADRVPYVAPRPRHLQAQGGGGEAPALERAGFRRRRLGAVSDAGEGGVAARLLLLGKPGAPRASGTPGHYADRPEGLQPLRRRGGREELQQGSEAAHRRRRDAYRVRHAARPGVRRRPRGARARGRQCERRMAARQKDQLTTRRGCRCGRSRSITSTSRLSTDAARRPSSTDTSSGLPCIARSIHSRICRDACRSCSRIPRPVSRSCAWRRRCPRL